MTALFRSTTGEWSVVPLATGQWAVVLHIATFSDEAYAKRFVADRVALDDGKAAPAPIALPPEQPAAPAAPAVEPMSKLPRQKKRPSLRKQIVAEIGERIAAEITELCQKYPPAPKARDLMGEYGMPYHEALDAIRWVETNKHGQWVYLGGDQAKSLFPPDVDVELSELSNIQSRVYDALKSNADKMRCCQLPYRRIATIAGINTGSVNPALYALERKGMIMLAKPGDQTAAAIYQILQPVEGA
jgi:hypothetical protein